MSMSFALPRVRSRRRKPWRPLTKWLLAISIVLHIESVVLLAMVFAWGPLALLPVPAFVFCAARIEWAVFQKCRREDES